MNAGYKFYTAKLTFHSIGKMPHSNVTHVCIDLEGQILLSKLSVLYTGTDSTLQANLSESWDNDYT